MVPRDPVGGHVLTELQIRILYESSLITAPQFIRAHVHTLIESRILMQFLISLLGVFARGSGAIQTGIRPPLRTFRGGSQPSINAASSASTHARIADWSPATSASSAPLCACVYACSKDK